MSVDLNELIYFENDVTPEEGDFTMTDFSGRHKAPAIITGDFNSIPQNNPGTLILFAAYASNTNAI